MKQILAVACLGALFGASTLQAENVFPTVPEEMGTKVEITRKVDLGTVDRSYLSAPDVRSMFYPMWGYEPSSTIHRLAWNPDGQNIYFADLRFIYTVPVTGGLPRLIFDSYYLYPFEGKRYVISETIIEIAGVSPDGKYLYFSRVHHEEGSGAEVTITPKGEFYRCKTSSRSVALERLDLQTGEVLRINSNLTDMVGNLILSSSGKYLTYTALTAQNISIQRVVDTATLAEWDIPILYPWGFSGDEFLLYSQDKKLLRIPIHGGDPEQVAVLTAGATTQPGLNFNTPSLGMGFSPDSKWALTEEFTGERYSKTLTKPDGCEFSFTKSLMKICLINLFTGTISDELLVPNFLTAREMRFSPDGRRYCYILENVENKNYCQEFSIYIKDFNPPKEDGKQLDVADASPLGFALTGNYPNPFNPTTTISFTLPSTGTANLAVYSITGQKIRDLVNGPMSAGAHSIVWDGRDASGQPVSSGVYLTRLSQGSHTTAGRMLLAK